MTATARAWRGSELAWASLHGKPLPKAHVARPGLSRLFPTAERLAKVKPTGLGMPAARLAALKAMAEAAVADRNLFRRGDSVEEAVSRLKAIRGIGEWTAQYIALRAMREMDAFPSIALCSIR